MIICTKCNMPVLLSGLDRCFCDHIIPIVLKEPATDINDIVQAEPQMSIAGTWDPIAALPSEDDLEAFKEALSKDPMFKASLPCPIKWKVSKLGPLGYAVEEQTPNDF